MKRGKRKGVGGAVEIRNRQNSSDDKQQGIFRGGRKGWNNPINK